MNTIVYRAGLLALLLLYCAACVRYYPSREEMNEPHGVDPAAQYVGPEAFFLYDREQRARLEQLIQSRLVDTAGVGNAAYKIGPADRIDVEVKNFDEVSKEYKVDLDGNIKLPFVGTVEVAGLTEEQLSNQISKIVQDYVLEPQVHVEVIDHSAHKIWIVSGGFHSQTARSDGETLQSTRAYPLRRPNYSLVELLVEIGYASQLANGGVLYIYPQGALHSGESISRIESAARRVTVGDPNPTCHNSSWANLDSKAPPCSEYADALAEVPLAEKYHPHARIMIDLEELFGGSQQPPLYVPLRPGDAIYIPPPPMIQVMGEVENRGTYFAKSGSGGDNFSASGDIKPTLLSLLAEAGGLTYAADIHNLEVYRELDFGKRVVLSVDFEKMVLRGTQDLKLRDGDIVYIPSKAGRFIEEHSINALNQALGAGNNVYTTATQ